MSLAPVAMIGRSHPITDLSIGLELRSCTSVWKITQDITIRPDDIEAITPDFFKATGRFVLDVVEAMDSAIDSFPVVWTVVSLDSNNELFHSTI